MASSMSEATVWSSSVYGSSSKSSCDQLKAIERTSRQATYGYGSKLIQELDRRFESLVPFARASHFGVARFFDPQPYQHQSLFQVELAGIGCRRVRLEGN